MMGRPNRAVTNSECKSLVSKAHDVRFKVKVQL